MSEPTPPAKPMTLPQVAKELGFSPGAVKGWIEKGHLAAWKSPGGHYRISPEAFRDFLERFPGSTAGRCHAPTTLGAAQG